MRVLVTGGAGYVGSVSVERLTAAGHRVTVLDTLVTGHRELVPDGVTFIDGSFGDGELVAHVLRDQGIEAVLHCAARSLVGESMRDPALYYRENVVGGITFLDQLRAAGVDRIVLSSTAAVYGTPGSVPIRETDPMHPVNPYGASKLAFEGAMRWYGVYGLRSIATRYFNVAGASDRSGEDHEPETHLIPNLLRAVRTGEPVTLFGDDYPTPDGTPIRDYIHVLDLADAHLAALEWTARQPPGTAEACNLGSGGGFSVREVLAATERVTGRPVPHVIGPRRAGDPPVLVAAIDRAHEVLGWTPARGTLDEMIGSAWAWEQARGGT
ncbi:MAG: UDP-glucose 4-epimerase GalE [Chloroflexi bacterium]|nr:UDP-glucose 4-epimerase GalE [Chloroflexota bacterium]